jgi:hypothetical protein
MSVVVLRARDFDARSQIVFGQPKANEHQGKTIYIGTKKDGKITKEGYLQSPWMFNLFGVTTSMKTNDNEKVKYYLETSFGQSPSAYVEEFHRKMMDLDAHVREAAVANCRTWLSQAEVDDEYLSEFHKPTVRRNKKDSNYPDTMKFKIPYYENEDGSVSFGDFEVYNAAKERLAFKTIDELKEVIGKSNRIRVLVKPASVWQSGKEFGITWRLARVQVLGSETIGTDCQIVNDDEEGEGENSNEQEF